MQRIICNNYAKIGFYAGGYMQKYEDYMQKLYAEEQIKDFRKRRNMH